MARVHITGVSDTICLQIPEWIHWVYTKFHEMNVCFRFIKQVKLSEHIVVLEKEGICKKHPLSDSTNINKICFLFGPIFACYVVHNKYYRGRFWKYLKTIYGPTSFSEKWKRLKTRDFYFFAWTFHKEKEVIFSAKYIENWHHFAISLKKTRMVCRCRKRCPDQFRRKWKN